MVALGMVSVTDVSEVGTAPLVSELSLSESDAANLVKHCAEETEKVRAEMEQVKAQSERMASAGTGEAGEGHETGNVRIRFSARVEPEAKQ
jgi:hypothetical protein